MNRLTDMMIQTLSPSLDLMPPPFSEGLCDWSRGDGSPEAPTYETGDVGRIARNDPDFGDCLELRKVEREQRLRYCGEMPLRRGACIEIRLRMKALRGPLPEVRVAACAGGFGGAALAEFDGAGPKRRFPAHDAVVELSAVIGRATRRGVDIVWDRRALYAHVGLDLLGPSGGVLRVENLRVRERPDLGAPSDMPGFDAAAGT